MALGRVEIKKVACQVPGCQLFKDDKKKGIEDTAGTLAGGERISNYIARTSRTLGGGAGPEHIVKRQIYSKTTQFSGKDQTILKLSKSAKILVCFLGEA